MRHAAGPRSANPSPLPPPGHARPLPPPTHPPTSSPTREYRAHHVVEAPRIDAEVFHPAFRVKTRLVGLAEAGRIDRRELEAAVTWRGWCEAIGRLPVQSWEIRVQRSLLGGTPSPVQGDAPPPNCATSAAALGSERTRLLEWSVVDDMNWKDIGKRIGLSDKTAIGRVIEAIAALSLWSRGLPVPDPPPVRFRNQPRSWWGCASTRAARRPVPYGHRRRRLMSS